MSYLSLEDLEDYDSVIEDEREDEFGNTEYLHDGEWYTEDELIDKLLTEDKAEISIAGGFVSKEDLNLHFPDYWKDDDKNDEEDY